MKRITNEKLTQVVKNINREAGELENPHTNQNGRLYSNTGSYLLEFNHGGVQLARIVNGGGASSDIFGSGYLTKRDCYNRMLAYLAGMRRERV